MSCSATNWKDPRVCVCFLIVVLKILNFICQHRKKIVVDSFTEGVIRRKILEAYAKREVLTSRQLHTLLRTDENFPVMCRQTLLNIMKSQLKFKYVKFHSKPIPFERPDITVARHTYLRKVRHYRSIGYKVIFFG